MYSTAFVSISRTAFEIEALSFAVQKENKRSLRTQIKCDVENKRNPVSYRKPRFSKRRV